MKPNGFILISAMISMAFLTIIVLLVAQLGLNHQLGAKRTLLSLNASAAAEAGAEKFLLEINQDRNYSGSGGEVTLYDDDRGKATYATTVQAGVLSNEKIIISTGKVYLPGRAQTFLTRKLKIVIRGINPFKYGLQTGLGPLYLYGNTGVTGEIYSNKHIVIQDQSVALSGTIKVADRENATTDCSITGNGEIPLSTINTRYKVCLPTPGSVVTQYDSTITPQPLPGVDKPGILASIPTNEACSTITNAPYRIKSAHYPNDSSEGTSGGCNLTLSPNKVYTLEGDTHIRGDFTADRDTIVISETLTKHIYVLVEGKINISGNGSAVIPNTAGYTATFVSYNTTDSGGDKNALDAIEISGNSLSLNARFLNEVGSFGLTGRGLIGQIAALSIVLNGSGSLTFVTSDPDDEPTDPNIWNVIYYQPVFD